MAITVDLIYLCLSALLFQIIRFIEICSRLPRDLSGFGELKSKKSRQLIFWTVLILSTPPRKMKMTLVIILKKELVFKTSMFNRKKIMFVKLMNQTRMLDTRLQKHLHPLVRQNLLLLKNFSNEVPLECVLSSCINPLQVSV